MCNDLFQHLYIFNIIYSVGWDQGLGYSRYGERFKEFRRMFHQTLGPRSIQDLYGLQETETRKLLLRIHRDPSSFIDHARQ